MPIAFELHRVLAWLAFGLVAAAAGAATPAAIPEMTSLVVDQAGVLADSEREALLARLQTFQNEHRAQVAILIAKGTDGVPLSEYSLRVAEAWQLGRAARDDGLLILVIPSPPAARIEVGYGLEGYIPDARASQWLDDLFPAVKQNEIAGGLDRLLDRIDERLPKPAKKDATSDVHELFPGHPEWNAPFVLVVFSFFAIFPMFMGRSGSYVSALLLPAFHGGAAYMLWGATVPTIAVAAAAFLLPLAWGLNQAERPLPRWLEYFKTVGNLVAVALFFSIITLFVGAVLWQEAREFAIAAPVFAGVLAIGLAAFLFPGKPAEYLMVVLRSACHFVFIVVLAYTTLYPFVPHPGATSAVIAAAITALAAVGLGLANRERGGGNAALPKWGGLRASQWCFMLAALAVLPLGLFALIVSVGGEDLQTQITQAAAGGGSIAAVLALAARYGLIAAVKIGLGGRFGGGGAERS